jgi:hypothetical protein
MMATLGYKSSTGYGDFSHFQEPATGVIWVEPVYPCGGEVARAVSSVNFTLVAVLNDPSKIAAPFSVKELNIELETLLPITCRSPWNSEGYVSEVSESVTPLELGIPVGLKFVKFNVSLSVLDDPPSDTVLPVPPLIIRAG